MPVFLINFFSVFFWALVCKYLPVTREKKRIVFLSIIFLQFTFLGWQRDFIVGQDTTQYYGGFLRISRMKFSHLLEDKWEPGYVLWNWIVANIGGNFRTYLLLTGAFINFSFLKFIHRYSTCDWLSVVIFIAFGYFFSSLHILRQYIAISIILYAYTSMLNKKLFQFIILVLLATCFHISAIVFIVTYPIIHYKIRIVPLLSGLITLLIVFYIWGGQIISMVTFVEKYSDAYLQSDSSGSGYNLMILLSLILIGGFLLKPRSLSPTMQMFYWCFFIAVCLQPLAMIVSLVSRAILYWLMSVMIFIPFVLSNIQKKVKPLAYLVVSIGLILFFTRFTNAPEGVETWGTYKWYTEKHYIRQ